MELENETIAHSLIFARVCIVNPLLKKYRTAKVNFSQPLSAYACVCLRMHSKQEKLMSAVIDNICISFI